MPVHLYRAETADEDARLLLTENGLTCRRVILVDRDSILYVNQLGRARTAWLHIPAYGPVRIKIEAGFECWPPEGWHDARPGEGRGPSNTSPQ